MFTLASITQGVVNVLFLLALILIYHRLGAIMVTQADTAAALTKLGEQMDKIFGEVKDDLQRLADAIAANGNTSTDVTDALTSLQSKVDALDALNPDPDTVSGKKVTAKKTS